MKRQTFLHWFLLAGLCVLQPLDASADTVPEERELRPGRPVRRPYFVQFGYEPRQRFRSDFEDADGSLRMTDHHHRVALLVPLERRGIFSLTLSHYRHDYAFRGLDVEGALPQRAYTHGVSAMYAGRLSGDWSTYSMGHVRTTAESGASLSDAVYGGGVLTVQHPIRENLQLGVGVLAAARLDTGPLVIPIASVRWNITDRLLLETQRGLHVRYALDPAGRWTASWNAEYFSRYVRLNDAGVAPGGMLRTRAFQSGFSLLYQPNPGMALGLDLEIAPGMKVTLKDGDRHTVLNEKLEPGIAVAAQIRISL